MPCGTLHNGVGGDLVIEDHGTPTGRFPLGADNGTQVNFAALLQNFKENLHLTLIRNGVQQKVVQNQQSGSAGLLSPFLAYLILRIF